MAFPFFVPMVLDFKRTPAWKTAWNFNVQWIGCQQWAAGLLNHSLWLLRSIVGPLLVSQSAPRTTTTPGQWREVIHSRLKQCATSTWTYQHQEGSFDGQDLILEAQKIDLQSDAWLYPNVTPGLRKSWDWAEPQDNWDSSHANSIETLKIGSFSKGFHHRFIFKPGLIQNVCFWTAIF